MAKELPYFRFTAAEWLNDDISLESYELKGLFIDVCAFYWFKNCSINIVLLHKRFSNATATLDQLIDLEIIKHNEDDSITINFLDEQFDLLSEKRKKRSDAGRIGGLRKSSNAKAMLKQKSSYKDKDKDKDKDKNKDKINIPPFEDFLKHALSKEPNISEKHLRFKYDAWIENGWKDGHDKSIKNWRSKLTNTIAFIQTNQNGKNDKRDPTRKPKEYKVYTSTIN